MRLPQHVVFQYIPRNDFDDYPLIRGAQTSCPHTVFSRHPPCSQQKDAFLPSFYRVQHLIFIMVSPGFGWSAGDIVASIHIIIKICQAFKEAGGATSQYKDNIAFLEGFNITLSRLDSCIGRNPDSEYAAEISEWLKLVNAPYSKFEKFLLEFKPALGSASTFSKFRKVPKKIKWAWKELSAVSSKVAELKREVCDPLMLLDTLLQMQSMYISWLS